MRSFAAWFVTVALLAAAVPFASVPAEACSAAPPCGYIFPLITLEPEGGNVVRDLVKSGNAEVNVKLIFTFDAANEGYSQPVNEKILVNFEYPRKPAWAIMSTDPETIEIPIDPTHLQPDADDPTALKMQYRYETSFKLTLGIAPGATPVLKDGTEAARLLLYAKSNEAGLYKAAYAIKEFKVRPEGFVYESTLAPAGGGVPVFDAVETPIAEMRTATGPVEFVFTPGDRVVTPWKPLPFTLATSVAGAATPVTVAYSLVDPTGYVAYSSGPRYAASGVLGGSLTFPAVGHHKLLVYVEPAPGQPNPAPSFAAFDIILEPHHDVQLVRYASKYRAVYDEVVTELSGMPDPTLQYQKWIPFRAEEGATTAQVDIVLDAKGLPTSPGTGPANLYVKVLNPDGAELASTSVDAANPKKTLRVSALPGAGVYTVHVFGVGAAVDMLAGARYTTTIQVNYDEPPAAPAPMPLVAAYFGPYAFHAVVPDTGVVPWEPVPVAINATFRDGSPASLTGMDYVMGVLDAKGNASYVSTPRTTPSDTTEALPLTFQSMGPGYVAAFLRGAPGNGVPFQGTPLLIPVQVGAPTGASYVYPTTMSFEYVEFVPEGATPLTPFVKEFPFRVLPGASAVTPDFQIDTTTMQGEIADASGSPVTDATAPGEYRLRVSGFAPAVQAYYTVGLTVDYPTAPVEADPLATVTAPVEEAGKGIPAVGLLGVLALLGVAALVAARRRS